MEESIPSPKSSVAGQTREATVMQSRDTNDGEIKAKASQADEVSGQSEGGKSVTSSAPQERSHTTLAGLGSCLSSEGSSSYEDVHTLSEVVTPDDSQLGSKGSSMQDMGNYFSPMFPDQSVSTNYLASPQTPPTPITELREWPPALKAQYDGWSGPQPFGAPEGTWRDTATQTVIGPAIHRTATTRPTSVPIPSSKDNPKRRRDGVDYPVYPDQSFAALQSQSHTRPSPPPPLRTRSSHHSSFSSITSRKSRDFSVQPSAKTAGNTPAQSPGLFSPTLPRGRSEDFHKASTLHPSHLQTPTETHKLLKDIDPVSGRKLINDYELIEKLGRGQHGTVKLGKNLLTGDLVAVKIVRRFSKKVRLGRTGDPSDMIKKEVAILKKARHGNVVSLLEVIDDDEWEKVYLVLEYVNRGEIVWRKWADKDVAVFEMNRVKREKEDPSSYYLDVEEVQRFNESVPARRAERQQALQKHNVSSFWSLELGGNHDEDNESGYIEQIKPHPSATALPSAVQELATAVKIEPLGEELTPRQKPIPRSIPNEAQNGTPTTSGVRLEEETMSNLKLDPSTQLEGNMYGAYATENASDAALSTKLEEIFAAQTHWSEEEAEYQRVPCLTLAQAQDAFRDTVLGLEYLHYQGIIHRDIKPANLLWTTDFRVKISDFGVSYLGKPIREDDEHEEIPEADAAIQHEAIELAKTVGTPAFYAPELCDPELFDFEKNPQRPQITGQIDVWALGVTLYGMIYGRLPFIDQNEMAMYERIAREEVFVSRLRFKGVEKSDERVTTNSNKRDDDVVEYEEVDDELQDLLKRLLEKNPLKRITIKEVKHHPWVLRGIQDQGAWVDQTDPSVQSEGKKIEVSDTDVQQAVVGLMDRLRGAFRRVGSVVRGRDGRKRTDSSAKWPESPSAASSRGSAASQDGRRSSLRGDEQIYSALRASREGSEHPLSQSVSASPEISNRSYFDSEEQHISQPVTAGLDPGRPSLPERTLSNTESVRTLRPSMSMMGRENTPSPPFSSLTMVVDENSSSSLGAIFGGAGRRFVNSMRSRERERHRSSPSHSSRSSSAGGSLTGIEDPHASPSIAMSSASAAGHVDQPPALCEVSPSPSSASRSTQPRVAKGSMTYQPAHEQNDPHLFESALDQSEIPSSDNTPEACPPSPDDVFFPGAGISSSSDQVGSAISESFSHPSVPSIVSGVSSVSGFIPGFPISEKSTPPAVVRNVSSASSSQVDEAGYNGGGEQDSDSDEDMLVMGGKR